MSLSLSRAGEANALPRFSEASIMSRLGESRAGLGTRRESTPAVAGLSGAEPFVFPTWGGTRRFRRAGRERQLRKSPLRCSVRFVKTYEEFSRKSHRLPSPAGTSTPSKASGGI
jgi:hypothetical protein